MVRHARGLLPCPSRCSSEETTASAPTDRRNRCRLDVVEPVFAHARARCGARSRSRAIGQGQPIPQLTPVIGSEPYTPEIVTEPEPQPAEIGESGSIIEPPSFGQDAVFTEPLISQPITPATMPEPTQTPTAPVVRTSVPEARLNRRRDANSRPAYVLFRDRVDATDAHVQDGRGAVASHFQGRDDASCAVSASAAGNESSGQLRDREDSAFRWRVGQGQTDSFSTTAAEPPWFAFVHRGAVCNCFEFRSCSACN